MKKKYQHGTIELRKRAHGPAIWQFRWRNTSGKRLVEDLGTIHEYPNKSAVEKCSQIAFLRMKLNRERKSREPYTFASVIERYICEEAPQRFSTRAGYLYCIKKHIRPAWGALPLSEIKPLAVQNWFKSLKDKSGKNDLSGKTKSNIRAVMRRIFHCAMLWEYLPLGRNPMNLVRIAGCSKRRKRPRIISKEEFAKLVASLHHEPCRIMVVFAVCTGLRCSELAALKWSDFDWKNRTVYIRRGIVAGRIDAVKTEASEAPVPLDSRLIEVVLEWKSESEFTSDSDFVFASPFVGGKKPYTMWNMQRMHLKPAAIERDWDQLAGTL